MLISDLMENCRRIEKNPRSPVKQFFRIAFFWRIFYWNFLQIRNQHKKWFLYAHIDLFWEEENFLLEGISRNISTAKFWNPENNGWQKVGTGTGTVERWNTSLGEQLRQPFQYYWLYSRELSALFQFLYKFTYFPVFILFIFFFSKKACTVVAPYTEKFGKYFLIHATKTLL
jgi:hypothetical protein